MYTIEYMMYGLLARSNTARAAPIIYPISYNQFNGFTVRFNESLEFVVTRDFG